MWKSLLHKSTIQCNSSHFTPYKFRQYLSNVAKMLMLDLHKLLLLFANFELFFCFLTKMIKKNQCNIKNLLYILFLLYTEQETLPSAQQDQHIINVSMFANSSRINFWSHEPKGKWIFLIKICLCSFVVVVAVDINFSHFQLSVKKKNCASINWT